jgi:hypothetical protein
MNWTTACLLALRFNPSPLDDGDRIVFDSRLEPYRVVRDGDSASKRLFEQRRTNMVRYLRTSLLHDAGRWREPRIATDKTVGLLSVWINKARNEGDIMIRFRRWRRGIRLTLAVGFCGTAMGANCLDSDVLKRFRTAYEPGLVSGLSAALEDPENAETGLREAAAALLDGLGAVIQPRTPASSDSR